MIIKKFGIEIRKAGSVENLYRDVDMILSDAGINSGEVNKTIQRAAVSHSLQKMLQPDRCFDICTIRNCAQLCGLCISEDRMRIYGTQHCVYWSEMLPEFRIQLMAMILDDFRSILQ